MKISSTFKPAWWLKNSHLQTLWAAKVRRGANPGIVTERLQTPDGDFVDLAWAKHTDANRPAKNGLVCLFHGLAGSINSAYASNTFKRLVDLEFDVVLMHFRGCSGEPNRKAHAYHSGFTDDIDYLISTLSERFGHNPIQAIGFSLGANALLKYLGEKGSTTPLTSAIAVAPPLVLHIGANQLNQGFSRIYQRYLLDRLKLQLVEKRERYPDLALPEKIDHLNNFWQFDNEVTAPLHGFRDVHDYYQRAGSRQYLPKITCRTHVIHALDDPFYTTDVIPDDDELPDSVTFEITSHGGHVGFVGGRWPWRPTYWLDQRLPELLLLQARQEEV